MTLLGVKTCGESEFDILEAKKCFPDSGAANKRFPDLCTEAKSRKNVTSKKRFPESRKSCVLKRKVVKM
jgi:hypothetical protein